jgi:predicted ATPase/DNA-binding SARP family transcriptional activator
MPPSGERDAVDVRLLGTFEVACGGRVLEIGSPKQRALLAMLVLHLNRVVPLDVLVEELWGDRLLASASASAQTLVSRLRRSLSELCPDETALCLRGREPGYVLEADPAQVDANRFEDLLARGRDALGRGEAEAATALLQQAIDLWRGPALADLSDRRFARLEASRLEEARLGAIEELTEAELVLGRPAEALVRLESHVADHPLRERPWGQLMLALYRLGRQADALRAYQRLRRTLRDELGLEPNPALRQLEEQILRQSPELEGPRSPPPVRTPRSEGRTPGAGRAEDTVVFLFTDIEASSRRWEGDQDAMAQDLARHDELLRGAVEDGRGRVFADTGDGLCAAFSTASDAVVAAVGAQRALLAQAWKSPVPLRVRMAIHAGSAEPRGDNYVGPTLNRAARLLSLGFGGQLLCSQATADLLQDYLPAEVSLVDLGEHALANLSRPEQVFQVAHPDLPAVFPALRSPGRRRHNLPTALTSFVGRARELEDVRDLLKASRLVTLTGVGGGGKTRLALEAVTGVLDTFPDGVWLVDVGPLQDPAVLTSTVAGVLGVATTGLGGPDALLDRLHEHLQLKRALLVLDNSEHLVEAAARLVHSLLAACPGLTVLVTSREILGLGGEMAWRVPPLSLPGSSTLEDLEASDAVALFCERARSAQPGFGLSPVNAAAVAQICRRLDGIPLALELAAARIRVLGAHDLAGRLDQRFRVLTGGARTAVSRHQTLRATMDWSYQLLPAAEQAVLRRLAVFPGSFDLGAAEAVVECGGLPGAQEGVEVLDLLSGVVDKSLVGVESQGVEVRYRLLEIVREYANERLAEAGEGDAARRRHRDFFLTLASTQEDPHDRTRNWSTGSWIRLADSEHHNFGAALEWSFTEGDDEAAIGLAAALWRYWWWARPLEGCDWLERALPGPVGEVTPERLEALIGLGVLLPRSGRAPIQKGEELLRDVVRLGLEAGVDREVARARYFLGELALSRGEPVEAEPLLRAALEAFESREAPFSAAWCHHALGWMAMARGERGVAQAHFESILEVTRRHVEAELLRVHAVAGLAPLAALAGEAHHAEALADDGVTVARRLPAPGFLVMALTRAGETALLSGRQPRAILRELLGLLIDLGTRAWVDEVLEMVALVCEADGEPVAAARLLGAAGARSDRRGRILSSEVNSCCDRLAKALGSDVFGEHKAGGRSIPAGEALAFALSELERAGGGSGPGSP